MTNLKTLKDLNHIPTCESTDTVKANIWYNVKVDDLREAAKEWIKELDSNPEYYSVGLNNRNLINWIKNFFNLE